MAKLVLARRIFPALGNVNKFSLLSFNGKIAISKTAYNIMLKGYVGDYDFDRSTVDRELAKNEGKQVNVLIDNLGGSLATGLSISAAFKNHGSVNLHFVGLNASAAIIASLSISTFTALRE
ncbi:MULTISPECIES: hypothetical protein [Bacteroidales]|uniref:hypothetical protein n=1 Tax=Bacteroidales TaxID=171549 RepID=UPI0025984FDF|nr:MULTISPECIES: hypothetical protein [Bacteroidales]